MKGFLLVNLGTPDQAEPKAVARYLRQFLMDPYVIDIPKPLRWCLVNVIIAPIRSHKSAEAYRTVWTERGSPLLFHLLDLVQTVQDLLGKEARVEPAMRYGNPSIPSALSRLQKSGVTEVCVLPLYPQYADSTTRSSVEEVRQALSSLNWNPKIQFVQPFYDEASHVEAWVNKIKASGLSNTFGPDTHLLMSYHGLPERHLQKAGLKTGESQSWCLDGGEPTQAESRVRTYACCEKLSKAQYDPTHAAACSAKTFCYRAHSVMTSQAIAKGLGLQPHQWSISFQSRLGRTPWIRPYTDEVIPELAKRGVKNLYVVTPSFVADCLETIEEIGDRAKEIFHEAQGKNFVRIECLNKDLAPFCVRAFRGQVISKDAPAVV